MKVCRERHSRQRCEIGSREHDGPLERTGDLQADVASGRFRADLFYRINVVAIALPPLRDRPDDVPELALFFLERHAARMGLEAHGISPSAMRILAEHSWPGNVRELEHAIERALVMTGGKTIEAADLPSPVRSSGRHAAVTDGTLSVKQQTTELEKALIRRALEHTRGNRTRAARLLELSHRALLYKIREYGLV